MPQSIGVSSSSLSIQRALIQAQKLMNVSMQRLSTGSRVNSAKDDPAAFSAAIQLDSQIRGIDQSVKNANDSVSLLQTAESSLTSITDALQRMREISVQSSNPATTSADRAVLQLELTQLSAEIDRIAADAEFNGVKILDGSNLSFQVGPSTSDSVSFSTSATTSGLALNTANTLGGLNGGRVSGTALNAAGAFVQGDILINGIQLPANAQFSATNSAVLLKTYLNANTGQTSVTATTYNDYTGTAASGVTTGALTINGVTIANTIGMSDLVNAINTAALNNAGLSEVSAKLNSDGSISLRNTTGNDIIIGGTVTNSGFTAGTYSGYLALTHNDPNTAITLSASNSTTLTNKLLNMGFVTSTGAKQISGVAVGSAAIGASDGVKINGVTIGSSASDSAKDKAAAINLLTAQTGVTATALTNTATYTLTIANVDANTKINGISLTSLGVSPASGVSGTVTAIGTNIPGITAANDGGNLVLTAAAGENITVTNGNGGPFFQTVGIGASATTRGAIQLTHATSPIRVEGSSTNLAKFGLTSVGGSSESISLGLSVTSTAGATYATTKIDTALAALQNDLGNIGALQSRLDSTINQLQTSSQDLSTAKSSITDADFAAETAALTRAQILQQAGLSILAQANAQMQSVLALLK